MLSMSYKILVNGSPGNFFIPTRSLRQRDPLSPLLFFLCVEGLFAYIILKEKENKIVGIKIKDSYPNISHLLFANDCYIISSSNRKELDEIQDSLVSFCKAFGQVMTQDKSELIFINNSPSSFKRIIQSSLGMKQASHVGNHLGPLSSIRKDKILFFSYIEERERLKVQGWKGKILSKIRKDILFKAVITVIQLTSSKEILVG